MVMALDIGTMRSNNCTNEKLWKDNMHDMTEGEYSQYKDLCGGEGIFWILEIRR